MLSPLETDPGFPSGAWTGFYAYRQASTRFHAMQLDLTFRLGQLTGQGQDDVGDFLFSGNYDVATRRCFWTKTYPGSHSVQYAGQQSGQMIRGDWTLGRTRGHFAIWPGDNEALAREFFVSESEPSEKAQILTLLDSLAGQVD